MNLNPPDRAASIIEWEKFVALINQHDHRDPVIAQEKRRAEQHLSYLKSLYQKGTPNESEES